MVFLKITKANTTKRKNNNVLQMGVLARDKIKYQKLNTRENQRKRKDTANYNRAEQEEQIVGLTSLFDGGAVKGQHNNNLHAVIVL